ncbi:hypothetical protein E2C01_070958 [Portunus trituberculatus]|uniref:Uncharacterized protein n=1 Tax=Portunus trituberculatus TaxID=210409 RepID=A0A5B7HU39_PORTR|nr:hypothetical protein [Portunus trituberculatus]
MTKEVCDEEEEEEKEEEEEGRPGLWGRLYYIPLALAASEPPSLKPLRLTTEPPGKYRHRY